MMEELSVLCHSSIIHILFVFRLEVESTCILLSNYLIYNASFLLVG